MSIHLDPAFDDRTQQDENNNRLVFRHRYLSVTCYRILEK